MKRKSPTKATPSAQAAAAHAPHWTSHLVASAAALSYCRQWHRTLARFRLAVPLCLHPQHRRPLRMRTVTVAASATAAAAAASHPPPLPHEWGMKGEYCGVVGPAGSPANALANAYLCKPSYSTCTVPLRSTLRLYYGTSRLIAPLHDTRQPDASTPHASPCSVTSTCRRSSDPGLLTILYTCTGIDTDCRRGLRTIQRFSPHAGSPERPSRCHVSQG